MSGARLGVDVGTSVVKAALFDENGAAVAVQGRPLELRHGPNGAVEQDLEEILTGLSEVVRAVLGSASGVPPALVALTGQGDGCWLTDSEFRLVRPALSWLDGRAAELLNRWSADGVVERVFRANGSALFPGAPAPLLAWLDRYEPAALDAAATAGYCKDAVFGRLTGVRATDPSDSSMPFGDGTGTGYSAEVLDATGLTHRRELLAPIASPVPSAPLTGAGAALLGLPEGLPVSAGPFDFPACGFGGGLTEVGDALLIVGTTLGCLVRADSLHTSGEPAGFQVATGEPSRWLRAMPAMVGTASLDWLLRTLGVGLDAVGEALATSPPGARGVSVLPYLATSGERAPFVDPAASGQITGMRLTTDRHDLVRAMCEGLAYAARHCFESARRPADGRLVVCGGGTRSVAWLQVFADVLGVPLELARTPEVGARGAVLVAARARGEELDVPAWTAPEAVVEPDPARRTRYDDGYQDYLNHVDAARPLWPRGPLDQEDN
ncbi:FGGY-family carbohydrate kinase [Pseudonocardia eucalypti]|uniref:FGGY-family carbohydrate kinase n=1 Tax=Pseudonocardia eucalypti TaxID=648755 RepID=A0ABP9Q4R2_9PSEU|nr:xylulokinase/erythritol kinase [Pseudonocardia eucalypti]